MKPKLFGRFGSITWQLVAAIFTLQLIATASLMAFAQWSVRKQLVRDQQAYVAELSDELGRAYREKGRSGLIDLVSARLGSTAWAKTVVLVADRKGYVLAGNLREWPPVLEPRTRWREIELYRRGASDPERMAVSSTHLDAGDRLLTGLVLEDDLRVTSTFEAAMLIALLLGLPIAFFSAVALGRIFQQRLAGIADTAAAVAGGELARRVPRDESGDAFDQVAGQMNAMLDRIDALVSELRLVTDGLAHDLRSPLTRVRAKLEQALDGGASGDSAAAIAGAQGELGVLERMISTALQISRAEAGIGDARRAETDITALLGEVVELYEPLADEAGFRLILENGASIKVAADRELLSQAIAKLIENAIKYADGGHTIIVQAVEGDDQVMITVADNGVGIASDRRDDARRRFGRLNPARTVPGSGLGLTLVEAIARLHGGRLELGDAAPGLVATLVFPAIR